MTTDLPDDDLMRELKAAVSEQEMVTDSARSAAEGAFAWRTIDAELLALSHDSLLDTAAAVRRTPSTAPRSISLHGSTIGLEIEVDETRLLGQVLPGDRYRVTLVRPSGPGRSVDCDEAGFFAFADVDPGLARLTLEIDGSRVSSPWLTL